MRRISTLQLYSLNIHICTSPSFLALPYVFKLILLSVVYFTHSTVFNLIWFMLINYLRASNGLLLVIAFVGLLSLLIYLTLAILCLLYNWCRHITLIISLFSCVVPSLIKHLQINLELVQRMSGRLVLSYNLTIALIAVPMSKPWAIAYNLEASTLLVILLHLTEDQWTMFTLFNKSINTRIYPIYNKRSLLFANKELVNISSQSVFILNLIKLKPLIKFLICY